MSDTLTRYRIACDWDHNPTPEADPAGEWVRHEEAARRLSDEKREAEEWKEAARVANAAIEHYQGERNKSDAYAQRLAEAFKDPLLVREIAMQLRPYEPISEEKVKEQREDIEQGLAIYLDEGGLVEIIDAALAKNPVSPSVPECVHDWLLPNAVFGAKQCAKCGVRQRESERNEISGLDEAARRINDRINLEDAAEGRNNPAQRAC